MPSFHTTLRTVTVGCMCLGESNFLQAGTFGWYTLLSDTNLDTVRIVQIGRGFRKRQRGNREEVAFGAAFWFPYRAQRHRAST